MGYQSYVNQVATDETQRRNSRIALEDQLKNSASTRSAQTREAAATADNALSNSRNATTNANSAAADASLKRAALQQENQQFQVKTQLQGAELGLKAAAIGEDARQADMRYGLEATRVNMDQQKLGPELEHLNLQNDTDRINYGSAILDYHMKQAVTNHDLNNLPKIFAMQDAMMDAKTVGYKSEVGLQKWGLLARYGSGISNALENNRQQDALTLYDSMQKDMEDMGIDGKGIAILSMPPSSDTKDTWKLFSDTAISSAEFRSQLALEAAKGGGAGVATLLKVMQAQLAGQRDQRGAEDQASQNIATLQREVGAGIFASMFQVPTNKDGAVKPDAAGQKASPMYQNLVGTVQGMTMDPDTGQFRPGMNIVKAKQLAMSLSQQLKPMSVPTPGTMFGDETFALSTEGILPNEKGQTLYKNPIAEITAVMDNDLYKSVIRPGLDNFANLYANSESLKRGILATANQMDTIADPLARARVFENLVHTLTSLKILRQ